MLGFRSAEMISPLVKFSPMFQCPTPHTYAQVFDQLPNYDPCANKRDKLQTVKYCEKGNEYLFY